MMSMPTIIRVSGPWGLALLLLAAVVIFLTVRAALTALKGSPEARGALRDQSNAILFWGVASAVMGFLGQWQGAWVALDVIMSAPELSPQVLAEGFVISFVPTLFGLGIFSFSGIVWLSLRVFPVGGLRILFLVLSAPLGAISARIIT